MKKFPSKFFNSASSYAKKYFEEKNQVSKLINLEEIEKASLILKKNYMNRKKVFVCGNGGSLAISNHFLCDHMKGISSKTKIFPRIISLSSNMEIISAISNDISFDDVFVFQLSNLADKNDCLITISSSGNSKNIIKSIEWAKKNNLNTISFNGFNGGKASRLSEININVPSKNYGIVEDIHQSIMHILAHSIRMHFMSKNDFKKSIF